MNFSPIPLTAAVVNLALTLFVLSRGLRSNVKRVYVLWGLSVSLWNMGTFFMFIVKSESKAMVWAHILQFGVIFLPISLAHLCLLIANVSWGRAIYILYAFSIGLALSNFTSFFVKGVEYLPQLGAYYSQAGPGFWLFVPTYIVPILAVMAFYSRMGAMPPMHRIRLHALVSVVAALIFFGVNDTLPILGIYHYPFTNLRIIPLGSLAAIFYGIIVGYSVLQHQLLDVHIVLGRFAAHLLRIGFIFVIGATLLVVCEFALHEKNPAIAFSIPAFCCALGVLLISFISASVLFPRLFGTGGDALERRLMGDRFEYHDKVRNFIASMQWYSDTNLLLSDLHELLLKTICLQRYQIILLDETSRVFSLFRSFPEEPPRTFPDIHHQSPIFQFFQATKAEYMTLNIAYATPGSGRIERDACEELKVFGAEFCFPFQFEDEPFGFLFIGGKTNGEPYTSTDLSLFVSLVKNLSMVINQIRLKNQIMQTQELELLGRMSRGMAHDLNNLLTPIWTLLQLVGEGASTQDLSEDLLPVALRNIKTMRAYIRESLFFSENLRPDFQLGRLDVLIAQAVDITQARREAKGINVIVDTPGEVLVEMDEVLIQRLVANIVSNAIDASPPHSTIRVELVRLVKTEMTRDWLRVRIIDNGEGIKPENLSRVLTPYFTTKDRGDKDRGFGLGLAICRKIVHLHGGNLNIASQLKKGTTVQVDLPSRQTKLSVPATSYQ